MRFLVGRRTIRPSRRPALSRIVENGSGVDDDNHDDSSYEEDSEEDSSSSWHSSDNSEDASSYSSSYDEDSSVEDTESFTTASTSLLLPPRTALRYRRPKLFSRFRNTTHRRKNRATHSSSDAHHLHQHHARIIPYDKKAHKASLKLERELQQMGYNLDTQSYITRDSSKKYPKDKYRKPEDESVSTSSNNNLLLEDRNDPSHQYYSDKYQEPRRQEPPDHSGTSRTDDKNIPFASSGILQMRSQDSSSSPSSSLRSGDILNKYPPKKDRHRKSKNTKKTAPTSTTTPAKEPQEAQGMSHVELVSTTLSSKKKQHKTYHGPMVPPTPNVLSDLSKDEETFDNNNPSQERDNNHNNSFVVMVEGMSVVEKEQQETTPLLEASRKNKQDPKMDVVIPKVKATKHNKQRRFLWKPIRRRRQQDPAVLKNNNTKTKPSQPPPVASSSSKRADNSNKKSATNSTSANSKDVLSSTAKLPPQPQTQSTALREPIPIPPPAQAPPQSATHDPALCISTLEAETVATQEKKSTRELLIMPEPHIDPEEHSPSLLAKNMIRSDDDDDLSDKKEKGVLCGASAGWDFAPCFIVPKKNNSNDDLERKMLPSPPPVVEPTIPSMHSEIKSSTVMQYYEEVPPPPQENHDPYPSLGPSVSSSSAHYSNVEVPIHESRQILLLGASQEELTATAKTPAPLFPFSQAASTRARTQKKGFLKFLQRGASKKKKENVVEKSHIEQEPPPVLPWGSSLADPPDTTTASIHSQRTHGVVRIQPNGEVEFSRQPSFQKNPPPCTSTGDIPTETTSAETTIQNASNEDIKKKHILQSSTREETSFKRRYPLIVPHKSSTGLANSMGDFFEILLNDTYKKEAVSREADLRHQETQSVAPTPRTMISVPQSTSHHSVEVSLAKENPVVLCQNEVVTAQSSKIPDQLPRSGISRKSGGGNKSLGNSTIPTVEKSLPPPNSSIERTSSDHFKIIAPPPPTINDKVPQNLTVDTEPTINDKVPRNLTVDTHVAENQQMTPHWEKAFLKLDSPTPAELNRTRSCSVEKRWDREMRDDCSTKPELDLDKLIQQSRAKRERKEKIISDVIAQDSFLSLDNAPRRKKVMSGPPTKMKKKTQSLDPLRLTVRVPNEGNDKQGPKKKKGTEKKRPSESKIQQEKSKQITEISGGGSKRRKEKNLRSSENSPPEELRLPPPDHIAGDEELLRMLSGLSDRSPIEDPRNALKNLKKNAKRLGVRESDLLLALRSSESQSIDVFSDQSAKSLTIGEEILDVLKTYFGDK